VFCGRHLLAAKLRPANIDASAGAVEEMARIVAQIGRRWPKVRVLLRADSGFAREALMAWPENNGVDFLFGLAKNSRLVGEIEAELAAAAEQSRQTEKPARRFKRKHSEMPELRAGLTAGALGIGDKCRKCGQLL
jgi:DDE family transposase